MHSGGCRIPPRKIFNHLFQECKWNLRFFFVCVIACNAETRHQLDAYGPLHRQHVNIEIAKFASGDRAEKPTKSSRARRRAPGRVRFTAREKNAMETLLHNLRVAFRSLVRTPALLLVATLSLGLGIGVNTTI